jgi:anti-sigma B factor antagonist
MRAEESEAFHVDTVELDGHAELRLVGELDMGTAPRLAAALEPVYEHGVATLVLDLSQLQFIDSTGLSHLVKALKRQQTHGGDVVLHAPTDQTRRVLELVGMTTLFTITE